MLICWTAAYIAGAGHAGDTRNLERIVLRILYARRDKGSIAFRVVPVGPTPKRRRPHSRTHRRLKSGTVGQAPRSNPIPQPLLAVLVGEKNPVNRQNGGARIAVELPS